MRIPFLKIPDRNNVHQEFEDFKSLVRLEKKKLVLALIWIVPAISLIIYWWLYPPILNQDAFPVFLALFSIVFAILIIGINLLNSALISNAVETEKFNQRLMSKLNEIKPDPESPGEKRMTDLNHPQIEKKIQFIKDLLIGIISGLCSGAFIVIYYKWTDKILEEKTYFNSFFPIVFLASLIFGGIVLSLFIALYLENKKIQRVREKI